MACCRFASGQAGSAQALTTPLLRPAGLVFDAAGNLYLAEQSGNVVVRISPSGLVSAFAGNGTQGFSGDGGPALAAQLDGPVGLALDVAGNLYIADQHNHRIRKVDVTTGLIVSIVNGILPTGMALDAAGNLLYADDLKRQLHQLNLITGTDQVLAGNGVQGSRGNGGAALSATLDAPFAITLGSNGRVLFTDPHSGMVRAVDSSGTLTQLSAIAGVQGLAVDASGQAYVADPVHHQLLQLTANGAVQIIAGTGTQGFAGDGGPATGALLNQPSWLTFSPAGLLTFTDQGNNRVRQIDAQGIIRTIAGVGAIGAEQLTLSGPSVVLYGTGIVTANLQAGPASGTVILKETADATTQTQAGSQPLSGNAASFSVAALPAGQHRLQAVYAGDSTHSSAISAVLPLTVSPATLTITPSNVSLLYGQPVPALTGSVQGVLAQDVASVSVVYASRASLLSAPGSYAITAAAAGTTAANYTLDVQPAQVTIAKAPVLVTLSSPGSGQLQVHVASTTSGLPQGTVTVLDGAAAVGAGSIDSSGNVSLSAAALSTGSHTLTAAYAGNGNFLAGTSSPLLLTIAPVAPTTQPDFTLAVTGPSTVSVPAGSAAQFAFVTSPVNGTLSSQIQLAASGLPNGATASFNPAYLPPGGAVSAFVLTVQTPHAALKTAPPPYWFALLLPLLVVVRKRALRRWAFLLLLAAVPAAMTGCGDRVNGNFFQGEAAHTYNITVTATATQPNGTVIQHTAVVTLRVQ